MGWFSRIFGANDGEPRAASTTPNVQPRTQPDPLFSGSGDSGNSGVASQNPVKPNPAPEQRVGGGSAGMRGGASNPVPVLAVGDAPRTVPMLNPQSGKAVAVEVGKGGGPILVTPAILMEGMRPSPATAPVLTAWARGLTDGFARTGRWTPLGAACVLAIVRKETGHLARWDENLYYTDPARVRQMFGDRAGPDPSRLLRNPKLLGDTVYAHLGGYMARGLGGVQLTGIQNHTAFAKFVGMPLDEARRFMETILGAALTAPWYVWHNRGQDAANRGDMLAVIGLVAGRKVSPGTPFFDSIGGPERMRGFEVFRRLLGA